MQKYRYGGKAATVENAAGVTGILIRSGGSYLFRVMDEDNPDDFIDYAIKHDDLKVTISKDELASFYTTDTHQVIDLMWSNRLVPPS